MNFLGVMCTVAALVAALATGITLMVFGTQNGQIVMGVLITASSVGSAAWFLSDNVQLRPE